MTREPGISSLLIGRRSRPPPTEMPTIPAVARHLLLHSILVLLLTTKGTETLMCGSPGRTDNGTVSLYSANVYNPGQRAEYSCLPGFTLLGNSTRTCQNDGLWSGNWPRCVRNLAYQKPVASSRVVNHYRPDLIADGNPQSCIYLDMRVQDRFIQIDLGRNYLIDGLVIHVPDGYVQELTVFIAEKLPSSPGIQYRRCVQGTSRISGSSLRIECQTEEDAAPVPGRFLHIRDERKIHDFYFALCEIQVYQEEPLSCGMPDQPAFSISAQPELFHSNQTEIGNIQRAGILEINCQPGFRLRGPRTLRCIAGQWVGQGGSFPQCIAVECEPLSGLKNGHIDFYPPARGGHHSILAGHDGHSSHFHSGNHSFNSVARHRCSDGFILTGGDEARTCREDGRWSGSSPVCRPIDCEEPNPIYNGEFQPAQEESSNTYRPGSIVHYNCVEGFLPQKIDETKPLETWAICQKDGRWNEVNFYCGRPGDAGGRPTPIAVPASVDPAEGGIAIPTGRHASWPSVPETENVSSSIRAKEVQEGNEGDERVEEDVNAENGSTAAAATGFAVVVLLLLILTAGIGLNICRMRTVLERVTKRLSTSVSNQLIGVAASAIPNKEAVHLQMDSPINIHQAKVEIEPVYNELSSPSPSGSSNGTTSLIPPPDGRISSSGSGLGCSEEEDTYLDIDLGLVTGGGGEDPPPLDAPPAKVPPETPEEIRLLYARVDKSKKTKNRLLFLTSSEGVSRPLPPLPDSTPPDQQVQEDQHIYATLPHDSTRTSFVKDSQ